MTAVTNDLQSVALYLEPGLAALDNYSCAVNRSNKKFDNFQNTPGQLGQTVDFRLPSRFRTQNSLIVNFTGVEDRVESLTVDTAFSVPMAFTFEELMFFVKNKPPEEISNIFMQKYGRAAMKELSASMESYFLSGITSSAYRFYSPGYSSGANLLPINSFGQVSTALARYRTYGHAESDLDVYIDDLAEPDIVNTGANQFTPKRNDEMVQAWKIGDYFSDLFMRSNLLPIQVAGSVGNLGQTLTVVTATPVSGVVTSITFSGASTSDAGAIKAGDKLEFQTASGLRFLTFTGHTPTGLNVQVRATADAGSNGSGNVTVSISPGLIYDATNVNPNANINIAVAAGMTVRVLPTHREGLIITPEAFLGAIPKLPAERPFDGGSMTDEDTGASLRISSGAILGQNQRGTYFSAIAGRRIIPEYAMAMIFPV